MNLITLVIIAILWGGLFIITHRWGKTSSLSYAPFVAEMIAATGLLALATVGFFWQVLLTQQAWMPAGGGDLAPFLYPNYYFAAQHLREGTIPLWNPHLYSGTPFAADIQSGLFYPINWLVFFLVPELTFEWLEYLAIFHFWLAGALMYLCLRLLVLPIGPQSLSPYAAFFGAIAFEFSDLFIVHFGNLNMIAVAAWLPLIFLLYHHSLIRRSYGLAAASGAVLAIATLAGHIQITLFILLTLGLYTLYVLRESFYDLFQWLSKNSGSTKSSLAELTQNIYPPIVSLAIALVITIALSALLFFPAYEMSQYTPRAELPYAEAAQFSLHPAKLVGLLVPNYFGRDPALHWGPWDRVETGYIGLITLMVALFGAILSPRTLKYFFIGLAILALLLAMGGYSIVHGWLYATLPAFDQLRAPARFILLMNFALAGLAAFGVHQVMHLSEEKRRVLGQLLKPLSWALGGLIIVAAPLSYFAVLVTQDRNRAIFDRATGAATGVAIFAIFSIASLITLHLINNRRLRKWSAGTTLIIILALDLFTLGSNVDVGHTDPTLSFNHPEAIEFLKNDEALFRIEVTTDIWHLWQPDTGLLHGLDDVWGLYNPLTLADTTLYWSGAPPRNSGRYNFLGVKYIIASKAGAPADGNIVPVFDGDPGVNIYLNQDAMVRASFVGKTQVVADHDAAWEAIRADDFDPTTMVVLEDGQALDNNPTASLEIWQYDLHEVTIRVETDQPGYLVIPDAYYPGWNATVSNQPATIERANYAFRAVYVPEGQHVVKFIFAPLIWRVGLIVSGVTLVGLIVWAGLAFNGSKQK